jgi:hypothetical protein
VTPPDDDGGPTGDTMMPIPIQGNYMFVTSDTRAPGALGGTDGADLWCNQLAGAAHLPGHYIAWISSSTSSARARLGAMQPRGWYRVDGLPFADTLDDLTMNGKVLYPPRVDERGANLDSISDLTPVATGTSASGDDTPGFDCADFTSMSGMVAYGQSTDGSYAWTEAGSNVLCSEPARIYCFGDNENRYPVAASPQPGTRRAFVTRMGTATSTTGLSGMDAKCQTEASTAGLSGTFSAWLAIQAQAANARFAHGEPWVRGDNVTAIAGDFSAMLAPLNVDAFGGYHTGFAWSGSYSPDTPTPSSAPYDCNDWTFTSASSYVGHVEYGTFGGAFFDGLQGAVVCTNSPYLYCLEQ